MGKNLRVIKSIKRKWIYKKLEFLHTHKEVRQIIQKFDIGNPNSYKYFRSKIFRKNFLKLKEK